MEASNASEPEERRRRLEEMATEICGGEVEVGSWDPVTYGFPIRRRTRDEEALLTQIPDVWIQKGDWERVREQLEELCG